MPHLSPMNWLMAILSIWFLILLISSVMWWNTSSKWPSMMYNSSTSHTLHWPWS